MKSKVSVVRPLFAGALNLKTASPVAQPAPVALSMLAVSDGAEVEVRAVHSGTLTVAGVPR